MTRHSYRTLIATLAIGAFTGALGASCEGTNQATAISYCGKTAGYIGEDQAYFVDLTSSSSSRDLNAWYPPDDSVYVHLVDGCDHGASVHIADPAVLRIGDRINAKDGLPVEVTLVGIELGGTTTVTVTQNGHVIDTLTILITGHRTFTSPGTPPAASGR